MSFVFPPRGLNSTAPFNPAAGITQVPSTEAVPAPPHKASAPFVAAQHRPDAPDGYFRIVVLVSGGEWGRCVADIVAALCKDTVALQIVRCGTPSFVTQHGVDVAVKKAWGVEGDEYGVRVWSDEDEWTGWSQPGNALLHQELAQWANAVLVAPCSADMLAKMACGFSEGVGLSVLRCLPPSTPVIVCPAMNAQMYRNQFTRKHLAVLKEELGFDVLQPREPHLAESGDMPDWRDIVIALQDMAALYRMRRQQHKADAEGDQMSLDAPPPPAGAIVDNTPSEEDGLCTDPPPRFPSPLWMFRPIWGEASYQMFDAQSIGAMAPPLPSERTEMQRTLEAQEANNTPNAHPDDLPLSLAPPYVRVMSTTLYGDSRHFSS